MSAVLEVRGRATRTTTEERRRWRSWQAAFEPDRILPMGLAMAVALLAWLLVYAAKSTGMSETLAAQRRGELVNLNAVRGVGQLEAALRGALPDSVERAGAAARVFALTPAGGARRPLENVGALATLRTLAPVDSGRRLFSVEQFQALKAPLVVREAGRFRSEFLRCALILVAAFAFMHVGLHATGRSGDRWLLPIVFALTGIGFAMMVSLRDPLRDQMLFARFAEGTLLGGAALVLCAIPSYERTVLRRLAFIPLIGALALSIALVALGGGPAGSDARVNLFGAQPMELIRVLLVLFLAGYFATRWELLRELNERPLGGAWWLRLLELPRLHHVLPVVIGVAASVLTYFVQRDLGPALLLFGLFLALYAITRRGIAIAFGGLAAVFGAFAISHVLGFPRTVSLRTTMWLDPWANGLSHGDQIAHGLWGFAAGGLSGTGLGLGAPAFVPAAHTDLILAAVGEELGFLGLVACLGLYGLLVVRGFRIARRAPEAYTMYLALGLTLGLALETLLIAGGVAGLAPLSGVVTPFLSYGRSAQIVHFATLGILWSLAASGAPAPGEVKRAPSLAVARLRSRTAPGPRPLTALTLAFDQPCRVLLTVVGALGAAVVLKLAWVQVARADATLVRGSLALQADGGYRYQYNPRLRLASASLPRGDIYDRNGVLLATGRWKNVTDRRAALAKLGVDIDQACLATDERHYPFGGVTFHVLGDLVSRRNWGATNTAYVERSQDEFLSGYDDHAQVVEIRGPASSGLRRVVRRDLSDLVPVWRHRHQPSHPKVRAILRRDRDLTLTLDVRLQMRADLLLRETLAGARLERGAVVVMDADNGELLACVSAPAPRGAMRGAAARLATSDSLLMDRARFGLYPPGSTFKLVTAAAALSQGTGLSAARFTCGPLPGGRAGAVVEGRLVRDDAGHRAHGTIGMDEAMIVSCNAYFAQLGRATGWPALRDQGRAFGISMGDPQAESEERAHAIESAFGQAGVVATPLAMARVAAVMASGGTLPAPHAVLKPAPALAESAVVTPGIASRIAGMMRGVVTRGTASRIAASQPAIAGKTGTAQVENGVSHAWFVGYAPYQADASGGAPGARGRRIAICVLIENGGYGGGRATGLAGRIVAEAHRLGII